MPSLAINPKRSFEAVLVLALVILALEFTLAWAGLGEQEFLQIDPVIGWTGFPNKAFTWRREGFGHIQLNKLGLNDPDRSLTKPPNTRRILMLGDSLLESLQVDRPQNFCSLLEKQLSTNDQPVEVINCGASSYNFGQMYLRLLNPGLTFDPDLVILVARPDSVYRLNPDQSRGIFAAAPTFQLTPTNDLKISYDKSRQWIAGIEGQRMAATAWLRQHSRIWGIISVTIYKIWAANTPFVLPKDAPTSTQLWPVADSIIEKMNITCHQHGAKFLILLVPTMGQENAGKEISMIKTTATKYQIPVLDALQSFDTGAQASSPAQPEAQASPPAPPFFPGGHYTPTGHKLVADTISKLLSN